MPHYVLLTTFFGCSFAILGALWYAKRQKVPTKWKAIGKVKNLCIYPLKSGYRLELPEVMCTEYGPKSIQPDTYQFYDRNLIIYKESNNEYITADVYPRLALIKVLPLNKEEFVLQAPGLDDVVVRLPRGNTKVEEVRVFKDAKMLTLDCGDKAAKFLSRYIYDSDFGLRLGFHDGTHRRDIYQYPYYKKYCDIYPILTNAATGMYAYLCSYSLINQTSVDKLKSEIGEEEAKCLSAYNFRGNIVVEDFEGRAYVEDTWKWVKIRDVVFYVVKPNTRCCIVNIDSETSSRSKTSEPLATLKKDRQLKKLTNVDFEGKDPVMGCYMGLHRGGIIALEDTVYVA